MTLARRRREFADDRKIADDRTHFIRFLAYPRDAVVLRHDRESKCIGLVLCSAQITSFVFSYVIQRERSFSIPRFEREEVFDSSLRERGVFRFLALYVKQRERSFSIPRARREVSRGRFLAIQQEEWS